MGTNDPRAQIFDPHTNAPRTITGVEHYPPRDMHTGWVCPKCQRVHAPSVKTCLCSGLPPSAPHVPPEYFENKVYCGTESPLQVLNEG